MGYAAKPKDYKKHPEEYKGHVGHVSTVIRIALMGRSQSPDVWEIQQILGEKRVKKGLKNFCNIKKRGAYPRFQIRRQTPTSVCSEHM